LRIAVNLRIAVPYGRVRAWVQPYEYRSIVRQLESVWGGFYRTSTFSSNISQFSSVSSRFPQWSCPEGTKGDSEGSYRVLGICFVCTRRLLPRLINTIGISIFIAAAPSCNAVISRPGELTGRGNTSTPAQGGPSHRGELRHSIVNSKGGERTEARVMVWLL
jgi:hypothetical protein